MSVTVPFGSRQNAGSESEPGPTRGQETSPAVVYLAAATNTYGTLSYRRALRRVSDEWPRAVVMDADSCGFASRADWHLRWPFIRDGLDAVVVLSEVDGSISRETWLELRDATDTGLPCWFVTASGDLAPAPPRAFRLFPSGVRTVRRWAHAVTPDA